jgi:benzoylformate decarboxylase
MGLSLGSAALDVFKTILRKEMAMKDVIARYLDHRLSRRSFMKGLVASGLSLAAAESVFKSFAPLAEAQALDPTYVRTVEGTAGDLLIEQLKSWGVKYIFGGSSSPDGAIYEALVDRPEVTFILTPHEGPQIAMADGYARAARKVAFVQVPGMGLPNAIGHAYNAWKDRIPLVVTSYRAENSEAAGRRIFQEIPQIEKFMEPVSKWAWNLRHPHTIAEVVRRGLTLASTPPCSPVYLSWHGNMLWESAKAEIMSGEKFNVPMEIKPNPRLVELTAKLLVEAKSPVLFVGDEVYRTEATEKVVELAELLAIPVTEARTAFSNFPTDHPLYLGPYIRGMRYPANVDVVLNLGHDMDETGFNPVPLIARNIKMIHVHIDSSAVGRTYPVELGIVADVKLTAESLIAAVKSVLTPKRIEEIRNSRFEPTRAFSSRLRDAQIKALKANWREEPIHHNQIGAVLNDVIEQDAVIISGGAQTSDTCLGFMTFGPGKKLEMENTGSHLGWAVGAAAGVKLALPDRQVICLTSDGDFMYGPTALWTMARNEIPVLLVVFNNRSYNGPRNRVARQGKRMRETGMYANNYLGNPDINFADLARGWGVGGEVVTSDAGR